MVTTTDEMPGVSAPPTAAAHDAGPVVVATDAVEAEWDAFVESHPDATVDHLWGWQTVFSRALGHHPVYLAARRGGSVVGVLPLVDFRSRLFGRFLVSLPFLNYGGVLARDREAADALLAHATELARQATATHVELRHRAQQFEGLPVRQHKVAMRLALNGLSGEALWTKLDRKVRNQVRRAQKEGLTAASGGAELVDEFYAVFSRNMRDLGTPVYSRQLFTETMRVFPGRARVHVVRHQATPVAASITLSFKDTVLVPWASSLKEFRTWAPNMLLYWHMLEGATSQQALTFDFGRSSPDAGTQHFKQQWGAVETPMAWEYVLLHRREPPNQGPGNPRFAMAIDAWKRLPLWLTTRIGPRIVRHIP